MNPFNAARYRDQVIAFRAEQSDGRTLEGYAAVFNQVTLIESYEGTFNETIERGAFTKTLKDKLPILQFDHGRDTRTGSVPIGAIQEIREDHNGLFVRADLFDNPVIEPIRQAIAAGAIDGMSFRFRVVHDRWDQKPKPALRTIREVQLFELGPVCFPAYGGTTVGVRAPMTPNDRAAQIAKLDAGRMAADLARIDAGMARLKR